METLHILSEEDIQGLISLSDSVGWDYDCDEIQTILKSGTIFGYKNECGKIVSSAAIIPYDNQLASIGMVIVHDDYRGKGLGRKVTQACINHIKDRNLSIMLISTHDGKPMYEKMGFKTVAYNQKFICQSPVPSQVTLNEGLKTEPLKEDDLTSIIELDQQAFGDSRRTFLLNRIKQSKQSLLLKNDAGSVVGYGLSILGVENLIIGPIVAPNVESAKYIVQELARNHQGKVRIDTTSNDIEFTNYLKECGFDKVSQPPIMVIHSNPLPKRNNKLYAIAAQIFG